MVKLASAHRSHADFLFVYCDEAHAKDVWPLGSIESYPKHRSMRDRIKIAKHFRETYASSATSANDVTPLSGELLALTETMTSKDSPRDNKDVVNVPVVCDTMRNTFDRTFCVWPERYFVVRDGRFTVVAQPTDEFGYDRGILQHFLEVQHDLTKAKAAKEKYQRNEEDTKRRFEELRARRERSELGRSM